MSDTPLYKLTLRDATTPATSAILYLLKPPEVRPQIVIDNREFILADGTRAIDYGTDKKMWAFSIDIKVDLDPNWTSAMLTAVKTLYALRTTQTIQLVENWRENGTVYTIHFYSFKEIGNDNSGSDKYEFVLKEA